MNYKVKSIPKFEKELKRLAKKFPSLKADFSLLLQSLKIEPAQGKALGNECYKIRIYPGLYKDHITMTIQE